MPRLIHDRNAISEPETLEEALELCGRHVDDLPDLLAEDSPRGEIFRLAYARIEESSTATLDVEKRKNPMAFVQPSYEQCLKLNAWIWGINFLCDFDANRIGKTAGGVFNGLLWMFPNDPAWKMFKAAFSKEWGQKIQVFQRPRIMDFLMLQDFLDEHPELRGDALKPWYDVQSGNYEKFCKLAKYFPKFYPQPVEPPTGEECIETGTIILGFPRGTIAQQPRFPAFPEPSFSSSDNTLWLGAPDLDYHRNIILPEWRKWLPKANIVRDSDHDATVTLRVHYKTRFGGKRTLNWLIDCKSYEAKDTKWSGAAVRGILLTEGLTEDILKEIRQRFQADSFASWDYTPYEPRNTGRKSLLAHKVYQKKEELPLRHVVFTGFGIEKSPSYILPDRKRKDLIRMWAGKAEGQARIHGHFYSSSPVALSNLDREFHTVPWSIAELFERYPRHLLIRSIDVGYDHPTVCVWGLLAPDNTLFVYRRWSAAGYSIGERCRKIVELSNNKLYKHKWGPGEDDYYSVEYHPNMNSEPTLISIADYHLFKTDERTKRPYHLNYVQEGLILRPSSTMRPKDRANEVNRHLERNNFKTHPVTKQTPGGKIFFLVNGEGIDECLGQLENLFWARFSVGDKKGEPKDALQDHDDDDFDAVSYLVTNPIRYDSSIRVPRIQEPSFASLQFSDPTEFYAQYSAAA